jgi:Protein of unknown function (DUF4241)
MGHRKSALVLVAAAVLVGCAHGAGASRPAAASAGDRAGLKLRMTLTSTHSSLVVETHVVNTRRRPVHLVPDQCGRITEVVLARTRFEPIGRRWPGSPGAVKRYILIDQRSSQDPDRFEPRRPGDTLSQPPRCSRPDRPVTLRPGNTVDERWELPLADASALQAVGSVHSVVRAEVVEARDPKQPEFLDILPTGEADQARRGRRLRVGLAASRVVERAPASVARSPSLGQLYDRLLENTMLRRWLEAQPVDSWRAAQLLVLPGGLRFKAITTQYERAVTATAPTDASRVHTRFPGRADRARRWLRKPGALPPGIRLAAQQYGWKLSDEVTPAKVRLPSGRIVVGEYLLDAKPLEARAQPGVYPVHATLARYKRKFDNVALATLVLSRRPTVRWRYATSIAVDGGTTTITSAEGAAALRDLFDRSQRRWEELSDEMFDSLTAHDYQVTEFSLGHGLNLTMFSSGNGDGNYPVFVGFDSTGRPTRVVVDFLLLHLRWP